MFQYDFASPRNFSGKTERREAFLTFLDTIRQSREEFPFSFEGENYKGTPAQFTATTWGGYFNADNVWTVFISYRCNSPKHTIQHSWSWDDENSVAFNYRKLEFLN